MPTINIICDCIYHKYCIASIYRYFYHRSTQIFQIRSFIIMATQNRNNTRIWFYAIQNLYSMNDCKYRVTNAIGFHWRLKISYIDTKYIRDLNMFCVVFKINTISTVNRCSSITLICIQKVRVESQSYDILRATLKTGVS